MAWGGGACGVEEEELAPCTGEARRQPRGRPSLSPASPPSFRPGGEGHRRRAGLVGSGVEFSQVVKDRRPLTCAVSWPPTGPLWWWPPCSSCGDRLCLQWPAPCSPRSGIDRGHRKQARPPGRGRGRGDRPTSSQWRDRGAAAPGWRGRGASARGFWSTCGYGSSPLQRLSLDSSPTRRRRDHDQDDERIENLNQLFQDGWSTSPSRPHHAHRHRRAVPHERPPGRGDGAHDRPLPGRPLALVPSLLRPGLRPRPGWHRQVLSDLQESLSGVRIVAAHNRQAQNIIVHRQRGGVSNRDANNETARSTASTDRDDLLGWLGQTALCWSAGGWCSTTSSPSASSRLILYRQRLFAPIQQLVQSTTPTSRAGAVDPEAARPHAGPSPACRGTRRPAPAPITGEVRLDRVTFAMTPTIPSCTTSASRSGRGRPSPWWVPPVRPSPPSPKS